MRKVFLLLFLCFACSFAIAQNSKELKSVKLRSGINLSGYIISNDDGSVSVTTIYGDQLWYSPSEIESITDDPSVVEAKRKAEAEAKAAKKAEKEAIHKGFQLMGEFGGWVDDVGMISLTPCYRVNEHYLFGIGLGYNYNHYHYHDGGNMDGHGFSTFVKILYNFSKKRITPYVDFNAGYCKMNKLYTSRNGSFDAVESYFLLSDIGFMFRIRRGKGLNLALSAYYLPFPAFFKGWGGEPTLTVGVRAGWTFF